MPKDLFLQTIWRFLLITIVFDAKFLSFLCKESNAYLATPIKDCDFPQFKSLRTTYQRLTYLMTFSYFSISITTKTMVQIVDLISSSTINFSQAEEFNLSSPSRHKLPSVRPTISFAPCRLGLVGDKYYSPNQTSGIKYKEVFIINKYIQ